MSMEINEKQMVKPAVAETQPELLYTTRSDEVQEIIGRMPPWIIRRGIIIIALLVVTVLMGAAFIRYPDTASCQVTISAKEPPAIVFAQGDAQVQQLLVKDGAQVNNGRALLVLNNNMAGYSDLLNAKQAALAIDTCRNIQQAINRLPALQHALSGKLQHACAEMLAAARYYSANNDDKRQQELRRRARRLLVLCDNREQQYLLLSTGGGQVRFFKPLQPYARLKAGEAVAAIVSPAGTGFIVTAGITAATYPDVKIGQTVLIRPENYPLQKFGLISGKVSALSSLPVNGLYTIAIALDHGLTTTTGREIPCDNEIRGTGEIILHDKSILQQLLEGATR